MSFMFLLLTRVSWQKVNFNLNFDTVSNGTEQCLNNYSKSRILKFKVKSGESPIKIKIKASETASSDKASSQKVISKP
jgi:hypothetical protein